MNDEVEMLDLTLDDLLELCKNNPENFKVPGEVTISLVGNTGTILLSASCVCTLDMLENIYRKPAISWKVAPGFELDIPGQVLSKYVHDRFMREYTKMMEDPDIPFHVKQKLVAAKDAVMKLEESLDTVEDEDVHKRLGAAAIQTTQEYMQAVLHDKDE